VVASPAYWDLLASAAPTFVVLVEPQPMEPLQAWTAAGGGLTNTWYASFETQVATAVLAGGLYRRLDFVRQNATTLTARTSAALVNANLGSYFHDTATSRIYVSTTSGASPELVALVGAWFTLFFATRSVSFADQPLYAPLVTGTLPTVSAEMPDALFGATYADTGDVSLLNEGGLFDQLSQFWVWRNKRVTFRLGGTALPYSDFVMIATMRINSLHVGDDVATLALENIGTILNQSLPLRTWGDGTLASGPGPTLAEDGANGLSQPLVFGTVVDCPLVLGGRTPGVADFWYTYDFNAGAYGSVAYLSVTAIDRTTRQRTTLTSGTDYTTAGATLTQTNAAYFFETHDLVATLLNLSMASSAGFGTMARAMLEICGEPLAHLDTVAFTAADVASPVLARYLNAPIQAADLMRELEQSCLGQVYKGADGRWTIRVLSFDLPTLELSDADFSAWAPQVDLRTVLDTAIVRYGHKPFQDDWSETSASDDTTRYASETSDSHRLDTWLTARTGSTPLLIAADAVVLAHRLQFLRSRPAVRIEFEERGLTLMTAQVGDLVRVTRARAPQARTGRYDGHVLRIVSLHKALGPEAPSVRGVLDDLEGQTDHIFRLAPSGSTMTWATATDPERAVYGFLADNSLGYLDPLDPTTRHAKVLY
jgi:hypothetical protein